MESAQNGQSNQVLSFKNMAASPEGGDVVSSTALFARMEERERQAIIGCARTYKFVRDAVLFTQGQPVLSLALIRNGSVKLTQSSRDGNEVLMWVSAPGQVLGLLSGSSTSLHTCTATVLETGSAWLWNQEQVLALNYKYPQLAANLGQILSERLHELEERFREVATETVPRRIALMLSRLSRQVGRQTQDGIEVAFSREEMAKMTGTTLFTVSRVLSRMAEDGLVTPRREAVIVRDRKGLQLMALQGG